MHKPKPPSRRRRLILAALFAALVLASHLFISLSTTHQAHKPSDGRHETRISALDHHGEPVADRTLRVVYSRWGEPQSETKLPVLLLHGAPGGGENFNALAPLLAADHRIIYAPDLIGFAESDMGPNNSYRVQAHSMFELLDTLGIGRVHVVGWSNGGGVGIRMADLQPDRIASLTMLASVGAQVGEGSGSYFFEHFKYAAGCVLLGDLPEVLPHFGHLGTREDRIGWLESFWYSDQRALTKIMPTITTPTLIVQGRHDFLVMPWAAELNHSLMPSSKLIMLDASHFLPFMQKDETARYLNAFFDRHKHPGVAPETGYLNLEPKQVRHGTDGTLHWIGDRVLDLAWWVQLILIVVMVRLLPTTGLVVTMLLIPMLSIDFGIGILGMLVGRWWWLVRRADVLDRPYTTVGWMRGVLYIIPVFIGGMSGGSWTLAMTQDYGFLGLAAGGALMWVLFWLVRLVFTWEGRQRLKARMNLIVNHEYWPASIIYLPVLWWGFKRILRGKGMRALGAVNPGYADDGGVMGESKTDINTKLGDDPAVLHCVLIEPDDDEHRRIEAVRLAMRDDAALNGYPIIAKPDSGEKGFGVKLCKNETELIEYCTTHREPFILQRVHHGKIEVGVLFVRCVDSIRDPKYTAPSGSIYAITEKVFPVIVGDGKRTIRRLILRHRRYRLKAKVFLELMGDRAKWIPEKGEEISLGFAGNHAQGAKFVDGSDLITPELCARICAIVDGFSDEHGRGFDIGRFDLRCDSIEALKRGEGFGIVELNGVTSEPTNLYDPKRSIFWAWRVLGGYWKQVELLAEARIESGTGEPIDQSRWRSLRHALVREIVF